MSIELIRGDCLEVMKNIPDNSVDMILCDLPYGTTKCKWDIIIPFEQLWKEYNRLCKDSTAVLLFGTEPFSSHLRISNLKSYRYDWYWNKKRAANFLFMNRQPGKIIENISVFYRKQPTYNPQKTINPKGPSKRHLHKNPSKITKNVRDIMGDSWKETPMDANENYHGVNYEPDKLLPNSLVEFIKDTRRVHPTQKPVILLEYLIKTYSNKDDIILDNCMGSGSTGVACKNLGRNFIGIELLEEYFNIAKERIENS